MHRAPYHRDRNKLIYCIPQHQSALINISQSSFNRYKFKFCLDYAIKIRLTSLQSTLKQIALKKLLHLKIMTVHHATYYHLITLAYVHFQHVAAHNHTIV